MARRSLRPELNRIRAWVRQGRTDAWIAHQLDVTVQQIQAFRREHGLTEGGDGEAVGAVAGDYDDEIDLRAEDDALIAAELEAAEARIQEEGPEDSDSDSDADADADAGAGDSGSRSSSSSSSSSSRRRRGRRGGGSRRPRRKDAGPLEATFDHGEEGYGLWLDPAVQDDPVYAEYWAGHRPVEVTIEEEQIVIRRTGEDSSGEDDEE